MQIYFLASFNLHLGSRLLENISADTYLVKLLMSRVGDIVFTRLLSSNGK